MSEQQEAPRREKHLAVKDFVNSRLKEIQSLTSSVNAASTGVGLRVFQRLARYRRRRAMSWNIHLLPSSLRKAAAVESNLPARVVQRKRRRMARRRRAKKWQEMRERFYKTLSRETSAADADDQDMDDVTASGAGAASAAEPEQFLAQRELREIDAQLRKLLSTDSEAEPEPIRDSASTTTQQRPKRRPVSIQRAAGAPLLANSNAAVNRLQTHVFHAKRMFMSTLFGWRLPLKSTNKIYRNAYRFTRDLCAIHDASYHMCVELSSDSRAAILRLLSPLVAKPANQSNNNTTEVSAFPFSSKMYMDGGREGDAMLYEPNRCPRDIIGPVRFLWRQSDSPSDSESANQTLWLWLHPAMLLPALRCFDSADSGVAVTLRDDLQRFELRGPLSTRVLFSTLLLAEPSQAWNTVQRVAASSPAALPANLVLGLRILHPAAPQSLKLAFPSFKTGSGDSSSQPSSGNTQSTSTSSGKAKSGASADWTTYFYRVPFGIAKAPQLWNAKKISKQQERERRRLMRRMIAKDGIHKLLRLDKSKAHSEVHEILLVQRVIGGQSKFGSGWDVICHKDVAASLFSALAKSKRVLVLGVQERQRLINEHAVGVFPEDFPDSAAFRQTYASVFAKTFKSFAVRAAANSNTADDSSDKDGAAANQQKKQKLSEDSEKQSVAAAADESKSSGSVRIGDYLFVERKPTNHPLNPRNDEYGDYYEYDDDDEDYEYDDEEYDDEYDESEETVTESLPASVSLSSAAAVVPIAIKFAFGGDGSFADEIVSMLPMDRELYQNGAPFVAALNRRTSNRSAAANSLRVFSLNHLMRKGRTDAERRALERFSANNRQPIGYITSAFYSLVRGCGFAIGFVSKDLLLANCMHVAVKSKKTREEKWKTILLVRLSNSRSDHYGNAGPHTRQPRPAASSSSAIIRPVIVKPLRL